MTTRTYLRFGQLLAGSTLMGVAIALLVRCRLGLLPWDVWHSALKLHFGWSIGFAMIVTNAVVMLTWIPLKVRPGIGTIVGVIVPGLACDGLLALLPETNSLILRIAFLVLGTLIFGFGTAAYLGAAFGPGPRDGLMMGITEKWGWSVRNVRTAIEVSVLIIGWLAAGPVAAIQQGYVGVGTVFVALSVGPIIGYVLPRVRHTPTKVQSADQPSGSEG